MKIKLDENLPTALARRLGDLGHDVETVHDEGRVGQDDDRLWQAAQDEDRFFITQDLDFSDIRKFVPGSHRGLLLLRFRDPGRLALTEILSAIFATQNDESWLGCFVVASEHKIRVTRPAF